MADKSTQLILEALSQAVHNPEGVPLHSSKSTPGLFQGTSAAKQAAQRCKDEGYLRVIRSETKGRSVQEICTLTEKGLAFLLKEASPKHVLEDFVRILENRQSQVDDLLTDAQRMQAGLESLQTAAREVLRQIQSAKTMPTSLPCDKTSSNGTGQGSWHGAVLDKLTHWPTHTTGEDCPLPDLFRHVHQTYHKLTIGQFHDGLRQLHDQENIYLHPWTGPLYDLPEPPFALLIGHEIAYYASLRVSH